ncbi:MAG: tetratricopeptide repeat protein, partial [Syntrophobacteraceae bacterium]|nr:tetratricopeptide repeat protein [Syntrophobacteraceae bacterium]
QAATVVLHPARSRGVEAEGAEPSRPAVPQEREVRQPLPGADPDAPGATPVPDGSPHAPGEDFLAGLARHSPHLDRLRRERRRSLGEMDALKAEKRWEDILALFHPVEEKAPDLDAVGLAHALRAEIAFALGHLGRHAEAIALYTACVEAEPNNFHFHSGLAYTAYDSLYAARSRTVTLHPAERRSRIDLAHRHFAAAQTLRPDGVTNFYRQGMLYKQIQGKRDQGLPLFETAVRNWRARSDQEKQARHQERKNYVKSLYQLASCLLDAGQARRALEHLESCIREDAASPHLSDLHKHFALGKIHFALGDYPAARRALEAAAARAEPSEDDYVFELLARAHLALNEIDRARQVVSRVPPNRRRPYYRWTEADVVAASGDVDQACRILREAADRDRRGSHKALARLAQLEFRRRRYGESLSAARRACAFFQETYQNPFFDGLFWSAAALLRLGKIDEARATLAELERLQPEYPNLGKLAGMIDAARRTTPTTPEAPLHAAETGDLPLGGVDHGEG